MAEVRPFRALRYDPRRVQPSAVICPPHDLINEELRQRLRRRSPYNAVWLTLGSDRDWPESEYALVAERLRSWRREGVLVQDPVPSFYLLEQRWPGGQRRGLVCLLRVGPEVMPHERTFAEVSEGRLRLLRACRAQFSPILLVWRDAEVGLAAALRPDGEPLLEAVDDEGVLHRLFRAADGQLAERLRDAPLLLADGHHRYEVTRRLGEPYVLACLCPLELTPVLSTPRVVRRRPPEGWWRHLPVRPCSLDEALRPDPGRVGIWQDGQAFLAEAPERPEVVALERLLVSLWGRDTARLAAEGCLTVLHDNALAHRLARRQGAMAFLLPPLDREALWEVVRRGERLPQKSTYFFPKVPSGLLIREL